MTTTSEKSTFEAWLRGELGDLGMAPTSIEVLESAEETRLRFNSPTPVEMLTVRVTCAFGHPATALVAYWRIDDEWELIEVG